ncbi:hypothetical protein M0813_17586 [Anaeramoeba flamelloides]|uniref:Uncharacterized protein n=1 Tax=Anaeramoeba flamelloides TaxID=1746091 RepID=A0ABQ8YVA2_9EUKA|nr:hypothetical protein M0813_17586 [Anaeramoeba flamelloides]
MSLDNKLYVIKNQGRKFFQFNVEEELTDLTNFIRSKNKTKLWFDTLCVSNGLFNKIQDSRVFGWTRRSLKELINESLQENCQKINEIQCLLETSRQNTWQNKGRFQFVNEKEPKRGIQIKSNKEECMVQDEVLQDIEYKYKFLRQERKYWVKFSQMYKNLSDLEKISIGLSKEIDNLSVQTLLNLSAKFLQDQKQNGKQNKSTTKKQRNKTISNLTIDNNNLTKKQKEKFYQQK